jgi:hypothetical protein
MTFNAIAPVFTESESEIIVEFGVAQGIAGVSAFDLVPGEGIIIDGVPGSGVDPFASLLANGTGITTSYNSGTRVWTITATGGGGGGGGDALTTDPLSQFAATTSAQLAGVMTDETGSGALVFANSPALITPALGTPSALVGTNITGTAAGLTAGNVTTNANLTGHVTSVGNAAVLGSFTKAQLDAAVSDGNVLYVGDVTSNATHTGDVTGSTALTIADAAVTLAKMANLAQDQFIGRTTASTGVPQTATITAAARTVLDDTTVSAMVDTLGGASATGTGGIVRATSATLITPNIGLALYTAARTTEITSTPTGTTQTITLGDGNHQTLSLASTTGNPTITLTVPTSSAAGTLILIQHGTTPRSITWAVSSGTMQWMGGQPTWASDAVSTSRVISWRWNGSVMRLAATEVGA